MQMASKKGISITVGILAAITVGSFAIWMIPQNNQAIFSASDFENHLDGVKAIHGTVNENLEEKFQNVIDGNLSPKEYIKMAETSSSQVNSQIIQLVESGASKEWEQSYIEYIQALKQFNSYIRETIVSANLIEDGKTGTELDNAIEKANQFKNDAMKTAKASDAARP